MIEFCFGLVGFFGIGYMLYQHYAVRPRFTFRGALYAWLGLLGTLAIILEMIKEAAIYIWNAL